MDILFEHHLIEIQTTLFYSAADCFATYDDSMKLKNRSSSSVEFPKLNIRDSYMENYDADTWYQKDPEFIIRRHISYDRTNDQLLIRCPKNVYSRSYYYWELPIEKLARPHSAKKAFEKIAARPWGSVQVRQAILKALEYVYAGNLAALHIHDDK